MNTIFLIIIYFVGLLTVLGTAMINCEYRSYEGGHKFFKAFSAQTKYQRFLTRLQMQKDIQTQDMGKITYVGYFSSIITLIVIVLVIIGSISLWVSGKKDLSFHVLILGTFGCCAFNILGFVLQGLDSVLNRIMPKKM